MTMTTRYYLPIDLLGFHRPHQQLRKYVSQIPILKQESRRYERKERLALSSTL